MIKLVYFAMICSALIALTSCTVKVDGLDSRSKFVYMSSLLYSKPPNNVFITYYDSWLTYEIEKSTREENYFLNISYSKFLKSEYLEEKKLVIDNVEQSFVFEKLDNSPKGGDFEVTHTSFDMVMTPGIGPNGAAQKQMVPRTTISSPRGENGTYGKISYETLIKMSKAHKVILKSKHQIVGSIDKFDWKSMKIKISKREIEALLKEVEIAKAKLDKPNPDIKK